MSVRVYRPLSLENSAPWRPLIFQVGEEYYHAESTMRDNNMEFWANPNDLKFVGTFVQEINMGAIFLLNNEEHLIPYNASHTTCFARGPFTHIISS
jgi:hypothetical protein